jgi:hypothetical protein
MSPTVRCKFVCVSVTKTRHYDRSKRDQFLYEADFSIVASEGSPENAAFFDATPSGHLKVGTHKEDHFQVGQEYYVDLTPAE